MLGGGGFPSRTQAPLFTPHTTPHTHHPSVQIMDHVEWTRSLEGKVTNNSYKVLDFEPADEAVFTDQAFDWRNYLNGERGD